MQRIVIVWVLLGWACHEAAADQVSVPNEFRVGTPARAAEVNANFGVLVRESNAQDVRIVAAESSAAQLAQNLEGVVAKNAAQDARLDSIDAASGQTQQRLQNVEAAVSQLGLRPVSDQLICPISPGWVTDRTTEPTFTCVQASNTAVLVSTTFRAILEAGWIFVASGGGSSGDRVIAVFHK